MEYTASKNNLYMNDSECMTDIEGITDEFNDFCIESDDNEYTYCVLSIDIGVLHLGISVTLLDEEYNFLEIIWIDLINITEFVHKYGPNKKDCKLYHTKTFCDWLNHTYQENIDFFEMADFILLERQPPMGFVVVEQLIFTQWRDKTILISPNSMHKYFNIGHYDYEQRKAHTEKIAMMKITDKALLEQMGYYDRSHDIADSICIMLFWLNNKQKEFQEEKAKQRLKKMQMNVNINDKGISMNEWFEKHRYVPRN